MKIMKQAIKNNLFILRYAARFTPAYLINLCLFQIYCAVQLFFEFTFCTKYIIDVIQYGGTFSQAAAYLLFVTASIIIKLIWEALHEHWLKPASIEKLRRELRQELFMNASRLDLSKYDNPDYYNEFVWSIEEAGTRMDEILNDLGLFLRQVTSIMITGAFFLTYNTAGLVFVSASLIITSVVNMHLAKITFQSDLDLKPIQRKRNYFSRVFYLSDYAREIRLNPIGERLKDDFRKENEKVYPIVKKYGRKITILRIIGDYLPNDVFFSGYLIYLIYQAAVQHVISFGTMISSYNASNGLKNDLKGLTVSMANFRRHSLYVDKIRGFLAFEPEITDGEASLKTEDFKELSIENMTFGYSSKPILKDISLTIRSGEKIAFVGYNGAGKTTLTKLLMRLYDADTGTIKYNGRDIKSYNIQEYRALFGSVFQDYRIYAARLDENVKMDKVNMEDESLILNALEKSGFSERLSKMSLGLKTNMTKEFDDDGINLSGGEAQKLAIARVFAKKFPIIILDEPSSALDPISEYHLNETMLKAAENKTVIFISHRLGGVKMADRIYMLENGQIIESGSHHELIAASGKYAEMFQIQAEKYKLKFSVDK